MPWMAESILNGKKKMPMCRKHDSSTRVALRLRELGETDYANTLDDAVGIDTRPQFVVWIAP